MFKNSASTRDMLQAFLRAELDSPTEAPRLRNTLKELDLDDSLIVNDTVGTDGLLQLFERYRGKEDVFDGLEIGQLDWRWHDLQLAELESKTFTCRNNFENRYGTRSVSEVAKIWEKASKPNGVKTRLLEGQDLQPPILVGTEEMSRLVILEGHNRLISYLRCAAVVRFPIRSLVGIGKDIDKWNQW